MLSRRNFIKLAAALFGSTVASAFGRAASGQAPSPSIISPTPSPTLAPTLTPTPTASPQAMEFATVRGDQFYAGDRRLPIYGFNYYPRLHPWRTFHVGEWDASAVERELQLGVNLGATVVRTFIDYAASLDTDPLRPPDVYYSLIPQYVANFRAFVEIAGRLGLRVIVTLFDGADWQIYQPYSAWMAEEYIKQFIPSFVDDPRILCWDLQNEPDRAISTLGADIVIPFFKRISKQIRDLDANHLRTIGWIDRAHGKYMPDLDPYLDFWCFHFYSNIDTLGDLIAFYKSVTKKPILLEEFGMATGGPGADGQHTELDQSLHYSRVYALIEGYRLCGSVFWTLLDFPQGLAGNPPSPNDSPENHFGIYRLDYSPKPVTGAVRYAWTARS